MATYRVVWIGRVREVYYVEAETREEAERTWSNGDFDMSESFDGAVEEIEEVE